MKNNRQYLLLGFLLIISAASIWAQNPIIRNQFSADPTARVFGNKVYLYPSHDILAREGRGRAGWFCMEDYHVFSSANLTDWTDHGVIVSQTSVPWANPTAFSLWAPDCFSRNGKYYFYFPAPGKDSTYGRGFCIGVAIADKPEGPFIPQAEPLKGARGIDPNVFIDNDGQAYLYLAMGRFTVAKLKDNMIELAVPPQMIQGLPDKGLKEGPFLFERNGMYYMTYPHVENKIERLEYAMSNNPMGPFKVAGVLMDEAPNGCWTNHQSIVQFNNQWYLFYHQNDYSPNFDKNRSVRVDSLFFNEDGTIKKVIPTLRGVGITDASQKIQIDRYSSKSEIGSSIDFLDTLNRFEGWKTTLGNTNAWIQYNAVDFGSKKLTSVQVKALSQTGGTLQIRLDKADGILLADVKIPAGTGWNTIHTRVSKYQAGIHNLVVVSKNNNPVEIDWIQFIR